MAMSQYSEKQPPLDEAVLKVAQAFHMLTPRAVVDPSKCAICATAVEKAEEAVRFLKDAGLMKRPRRTPTMKEAPNGA